MSQATSFRSFVFRDKATRGFLWWAVGGSIVLFTIFKLCYPYPDFISDSYDYIESAAYHLDVNLWPIGYAKFLAFLHPISHSHLFLVSVQYALLQTALLFFFYTLAWLQKPSPGVTKFIFVVLLFNPLFIYISNCILSDALFASLTITWLAILLRQFRSPSRPGLTTQVLLMGLAFAVRPTAMYYPPIAAFALFLCPINKLERLAWILAPALLIVPFILFTKAKTKAITGNAQFSVFGGWQLANNALYMIQHIDIDSDLVPTEVLPIARTSEQYLDWMRSKRYNLHLEDYTGGFFLKQPEAPLKRYMNTHCQKEMQISGFLAWGKVSPMYAAYGSWLIRHYPVEFAQYYLWLNAKNYFDPPLEKFSIYNYGEDSIWYMGQRYFHLRTPRVRSLSATLPATVFYVYPPVFAVLNLYFIGCLLWLGFSRNYRRIDPVFRKPLVLAAAFLLVNFGFSVFAAPIVLRYQLSPYIILFAFSILLLHFTDGGRLAR